MSKLAFLFPGQGAQKFGMGKDFYERFGTAREVFDKASQWLEMDMRELCFTENERLDLTEYTQAALVTTCLAMEMVAEEGGLFPQVTAGLSLGEYCAIFAAGAMSLPDTLRAVRRRGILMERAVPAGRGSMAAVLGMEDEKLSEVIAPISGVSVANYNCPGQTVITGLKEAVQEATVRLKEAGARRVLPLKVSGPFHSPLLEEAGEALARTLEEMELSQLRIPYVTNVTGKYVEDIRETKELLARQISSPVLWRQSMETMLRSGVDTFVEIGPGRTLAGFLKKLQPQARIYNIQTVEDLEQTLKALA